MATPPLLILFVDDDPDDFEMFCEALRSLDNHAKCLHAWDGQEAIELLRKAMIMPHYIVMDVNMPRMDGKECLIKIKKDPQLKDIPVIFYSTTSDPLEIEKCKELGARHFVVKPEKFKELVRVLNQVLC